MKRIFGLTAVFAAVGLFLAPWQATAEPEGADKAMYVIAKCFTPATVPQERPAEFAYNCDNTGVMEQMTWTSWGADGAEGTGTDSAVECQPNCAQGTRLFNPIVVHAWNPLPPNGSECPTEVLFYSDLTIAYPEGVPPWINPGTTWDTGTDFVTVDGMPAVHYSNLAPNCGA